MLQRFLPCWGLHTARVYFCSDWCSPGSDFLQTDKEPRKYTFPDNINAYVLNIIFKALEYTMKKIVKITHNLPTQRENYCYCKGLYFL